MTPDRYWCALDSIDAYYRSNMMLLKAQPQLDLYQDDWNIRTYQGQYPPARTVPGYSGTEGIFVNSMLAAGTVITGGGVNHSVSMFTAMFAIARTAGWMSHWMEMVPDPEQRIGRPDRSTAGRSYARSRSSESAEHRYIALLQAPDICFDRTRLEPATTSHRHSEARA